MIDSRLNKTQKQLLKTDKKIQQLKNPEQHASRVYCKKRKEFFGACFGMSICIGGSILALIGLTLAVGNPPLGFALIGLSLVFDSIVLPRKVNKWMKCKKKEKNKQTMFDEKSENLSSESVNLLNREHKKIKNSFADVVNQLNHQEIILNKCDVPIKPLSTRRHKQISSVQKGVSQLNSSLFQEYKPSNDSAINNPGIKINQLKR